MSEVTHALASVEPRTTRGRLAARDAAASGLRCLATSSVRPARKRSVQHQRVIVTHYGGPDALQLVEEECPEPKAGEVRVKVLAAGVALPDLLMREGVHPETPRLPFTPGWDLVGIVDRLGTGVSRLERGQIVA